MSRTELRAGLAISASQLRDFDRCERAWWLASVAGVPEDAGAGGLYLTAGDLFDEACQRYVARMSVGVDDLVAAVRSNPRKRRDGTAELTDAKWRELATAAQRQLRAAERLLPSPKSARIQHRYRVFVPGYEDRGGVVLTGAADFRRHGHVWDTKTTADRGPGRGRDDATRPRALDAARLARDVQARAYAWTEFSADPDLVFVRATWVYVSKASAPSAWPVETTFARADVLAWFDAYARPRIDRMLALRAETPVEALVDVSLDQRAARANHDGCGRCFRRRSCDSFSGLQQYGVAMVDIKKMREEQAARRAGGGEVRAAVGANTPLTPDLEAQLRASLVAEAAVATSVDDRRADVVALVPINRPDAPANPHVIVTTGQEVPTPPLADGGETTRVAASSSPSPADSSTTPDATEPTPKRGRGRPRRAGGAEATGAPAGVLDRRTDDPRLNTLVERLEKIATAFQSVADAADTAVAVVNAELRALGVRL